MYRTSSYQAPCDTDGLQGHSTLTRPTLWYSSCLTDHPELTHRCLSTKELRRGLQLCPCGTGQHNPNCYAEFTASCGQVSCSRDALAYSGSGQTPLPARNLSTKHPPTYTIGEGIVSHSPGVFLKFLNNFPNLRKAVFIFSAPLPSPSPVIIMGIWGGFVYLHNTCCSSHSLIS